MLAADEQKALRIAESNAKAARDSADALPALERAYIFIDMKPGFADALRSSFEILDRAAQRQGGDAAVITSSHLEIEYQFINHGKTPAIIKGMNTEFRHWTDLPQQLRYIDRPLGGEVVVRSGDVYPTPIEQGVTAMKARVAEITGTVLPAHIYYQRRQSPANHLVSMRLVAFEPAKVFYGFTVISYMMRCSDANMKPASRGVITGC